MGRTGLVVGSYVARYGYYLDDGGYTDTFRVLDLNSFFHSFGKMDRVYERVVHDPQPEQSDHGHLVPDFHLKFPDEGHRYGENGEVGDDVEDCVAVI